MNLPTLSSHMRGVWDLHFAMPYDLQERLVSEAIDRIHRQERAVYLLDLTDDRPLKETLVCIGKRQGADIQTPNLIIGWNIYDFKSQNSNLQELIRSVARTIAPEGYFVLTVQSVETPFNMAEQLVGMRLSPIDQIALWLAHANFMPGEVLQEVRDGYVVFLAKSVPEGWQVGR